MIQSPGSPGSAFRPPVRSPLRRLVDALAWTVAEGSMQRRRETSFGIEFPDDFDRTASLFVHVPRTGGTSVGMALYGRQVKHHMWSQWVEINPRKCRDYFSFAVVRDPVKRFLSACEFLKHGGMNPADQAVGANLLAGFEDAEHFVLSMKKDIETQRRLLAYWHFRPQSDFLDASADRPEIKMLIPFEHLERGFQKVATTLGMDVTLPHLNSVKHMPDHDLSTEATAILETLYRRDIELLGIARASGA